MLPAGNTLIKMPSITGAVLWPRWVTTPELRDGAHTHRDSATMVLGRGLLQEQSEPLSDCCQSIFLGEAQTTCDNLCLLPETQQLRGSCACSASQQLSPQSTPSRQLACSLSNTEVLALSAASLGHSRLQQILSECSRRELEPSVRLQGWMCWRAVTLRRHPLPLAPGQAKENPAWEQGNCTNCIMNVYSLPLWVQGWLNTDCSLPHEQLGSGLALVAVLWKPEEKQMSLGNLFCRRCHCFLPAHLSQKNLFFLWEAPLRAIFSLKGRKLLFLCLPFQSGPLSFPSPPHHPHGSFSSSANKSFLPEKITHVAALPPDTEFVFPISLII